MLEDKSVLISLVVPVFNEEESIETFLSAIASTLSDVNYEVIFINDGSTDDTLQVLFSQKSKYSFLKIIDLSRNFGKEAALSAGLAKAKGNAIIPIDVDLQDPPEVILEMLMKWRDGYEVVLAKRVDRQSDSWPKRASANWFYKIHNFIAKPKLPDNVGDFRLMDRVVVDAINQLPESRRFMKGLFAWVGFHTTTIEYARPHRIAGTSKFNGWNLWNFALEGLTSFSTAPLRIWTYVGSLVSLASFIFATLIIVKYFTQGVEVPGYASIMVAVTFLGGLQLIGIGVLGEYLGRTYIESKRRPVFVVRKTYE
ncbi:glycosyltransferase family 2 protein [Vibrio coralliilyticus]|uniref:glycosyltransferase family 2 protein n=1 Tax=Vibrio coralliilyticus TaxID=190893 RepID=UPI000BAAEC59|nr:glycosyltransferase family 2 protein [Vibrio coralliilyticus]NOI60036.1 glycosyltransferase family 2 protein [Vibrio coralliilyticus]PAT65646.1 glycosyltransferase [Vibrio coralliilyticus]